MNIVTHEKILKGYQNILSAKILTCTVHNVNHAHTFDFKKWGLFCIFCKILFHELNFLKA